MVKFLSDWIDKIFPNDPLYHVISVVLIGLFSIIGIYYLLNWIGLLLIEKWVKKSKNTFDDVLFNRGFFKALINVLPLTVIHLLSNLFPEWSGVLKRIIELGYYIMGTWAIYALLSSANDIYDTYPISRDKPIKGYIQIIQILLILLSAILIVSHILNKSPFVLMSALGALAAVLMLIFKDTILSLVASVKIYTEGILKVGDWIEMPKFGVDGDVIDISLYNVRVQNWDKTIINVPTFRFSEEPFKNWRGMKESGGRRIKRSIYIDQNTITIAPIELIESLKKEPLLKEHIEKRLAEIETENNSSGKKISARNLTNIGLFRKYIEEYLKINPNVHKGYTFLIRQLEPTPEGLPIQIYIFSNNTNWIDYEGIQSDIFDHLLSRVKFFNLRVFQKPSGIDFKNLSINEKE